jgi:hypothetical protein
MEDTMINSQKVRAWATPLTIGAFALSAITGVMIFFRLDFALVKGAHEWFSWFLVIGGLFHVIGSWQSFVQYFSKPAGKAIMGVFALLIVVSFVPFGKDNEGAPPSRVSRALLQTPFAIAADVAEHQPEELMKELKLTGILIERKEETIQEIAVRNNKRGVDILNVIF